MLINFSSAQVIKKSLLRKKTNNKYSRNIFVQYKLSKTFYYLLSFLFLITLSVFLYFKVFNTNMLNEIDTFNGPAIRIKYYEGSSTYLSNSGNNELLREGYWFIKGVGLIQVDVKNFGNVGGLYQKI